MWSVHPEAAVQARMHDRVHEAERQRLATDARAGRGGSRRPPASYRWRLREAAGFGLVRTGLWLLDARRA